MRWVLVTGRLGDKEREALDGPVRPRACCWSCMGSSLIPPNIPAKTSIVFVLPNTAGALYKVSVLTPPFHMHQMAVILHGGIGCH